MNKLETIILQNLLSNEEYGRKVIAFLKFDYFQNEYNVCFKAIHKFYKKYNKRPTKDTLGVFITEFEVDDNLKQKAVLLCEKLFEPIDPNQSLEWLVDETERWCQERAMTLAILKSVDILKDSTKPKGAIRDLVSNALNVSFDTSVGHDFFNDIKSRYDFYTGKGDDLQKIPFRLDKFNEATDGGVETKSLNMILGGTGAGKSLTMCSLSADYLRSGHDVLYITAEMADKKIAQRIEANLLNMEVNDIKELGWSVYNDSLENIHEQTDGRIFIKEYPTCSATTDHFNVLLDELWQKKKFQPKVIMIDYLNICATSRYKPSDSYSYVKGIAEDFRRLAQERNAAIWSATQVNREGFKKSDIDVDNTSESFGIPFTADFMVSIYADEAMHKMGKMLVKQASKNRYEDINKLPKFFVGCNKSKMTLYNLEDSK